MGRKHNYLVKNIYLLSINRHDTGLLCQLNLISNRSVIL